MNPYEEIGTLRQYIFELEKAMLLIILQSKDHESPYSEVVWQTAEAVLEKRPSAIVFLREL